VRPQCRRYQHPGQPVDAFLHRSAVAFPARLKTSPNRTHQLGLPPAGTPALKVGGNGLVIHPGLAEQGLWRCCWGGRYDGADAVTARKDDAPAAVQAAMTNVVGLG